MSRHRVLVIASLLLAGCSSAQKARFNSSARFDPGENQGLTASIKTLSGLDKQIIVHPDGEEIAQPFNVSVGISGARKGASRSCAADIVFLYRGGKLTPGMDWQAAGGGERPSFRRESHKAIIVYYPIQFKEDRHWVKFLVTVGKALEQAVGGDS